MNTIYKAMILAAVMVVAAAAIVMVPSDDSDAVTANNFSYEYAVDEFEGETFYAVLVDTNDNIGTATITIVVDGVTVGPTTCTDPDSTGSFAVLLDGPATSIDSITVSTSTWTETYPSTEPPVDPEPTYATTVTVEGDATVALINGEIAIQPVDGVYTVPATEITVLVTPAAPDVTVAGTAGDAILSFTANADGTYSAPVTVGQDNTVIAVTVEAAPVGPEPTYTLTVNAQEGVSVTVEADGEPVEANEDGTYTIAQDAVVTLVATTNLTGEIAVDITGADCIVNDDGSYTLSNVDGAVTVTVTVEAAPVGPEPAEVTVTVEPAENGTVTVTPEGPYTAGSELTITVTPAEGYQVASVMVGELALDLNEQNVYQVAIPEDVAEMTIAVTFEAVEPVPGEVTVSVGSDGNGTAVLSTDDIVVGRIVTVTFTPNPGYALTSVTANGEDVTSEVRNNAYRFTVEESVEIYATFAIDADRPFTNVITLNDGVVIDAQSSITASLTQEVVIAGDVTVLAGGFLDISGKLTVQEGATLTIEDGASVVVRETGIADVSGEIVVGAGTETEPAFVFEGSSMAVSGSIVMNGAYAAYIAGEDIQVTGSVTVSEDATAVLAGLVIDAGATLDINGVAIAIVQNAGTVTIDSLGAEGMASVIAVDLLEGGIVDAANLYGTAVIIGYTAAEDAESDAADMVMLIGVAGVTVAESDGTMDISGDVATAESFDGSAINGAVAVGAMSTDVTFEDTPTAEDLAALLSEGGNVTVSGTLALGEGVEMAVMGTLHVTGEITATAGVASTEGDVTSYACQIENVGTMDITGKVTVLTEIAGNGAINAARYTMDAASVQYKTYVYTTLETALADGATAIDIIGEVTVEEDIVIPVGTTVTLVDDATLTIADGATATVAAEGNSSGRIVANLADTVVVDGTLVVENLARSQLNEPAVLSDVTSYADPSATYTNLYDALENASEGETVEVTRGQALLLDRDVTVYEGVVLYIPSVESLTVQPGATVTVKGVLQVDGTYAMASETDSETGVTASGATDVYGMMLYKSGDYTDAIAGAYFAYPYDDYVYNAIAPLYVAADVIADIAGEVIDLHGDLDYSGMDIDMSGFTGVYMDLVVNGDLAVGSITLGSVQLDATAAGCFDGTVVLASGSVTFEDVTGFEAYNYTNEDETVDGTVIGDIIVCDDAKAGSVAVDGAVVFRALTTAGAVSLDVPADAELTLGAAVALAGNVNVDGTVYVESAATFQDLTVNGTVAAAENVTATVNGALLVGVVDGAYTGAGAVSGVAVGSYAIVSPASTVGPEFEDVPATAYYDEASELYVTVYDATGARTINAIDVIEVENALVQGWAVDGKVVENSTIVGAYEAVYALVDYDIYSIVVYADGGIGTVSYNSIVMVKDSNTFAVGGLVAGDYAIEWLVASGYEVSDAGLTVMVNGVRVSSEEDLVVTLAGTESLTTVISIIGTQTVDPSINVDTGDVIVPDQPAPEVTVEGKDDGMSLTDILLIVLVVLIVVMAIIVAMRLMRS